ncbi:CYFA0S37e00210g1_1 [Cyberlindnera fabianii]|uniref:CYFA0S37e00210g1_1 n=1 Tax=Cyberlindnera fabianii TaxID=36022 RepID=A0A061BL01_CYBFA|nr:Uncharacterized protein y4sH [Cyberlindnera fabianii]CDR47750.1 CYFA0S37e00210g1_1 [Cyberlindnera fabianii]
MVKIIAGGDALYSSTNLKKRIDPKLVRALADADTCFLNAEFQTPKPDTPATYNKMYLTSIRPEAFDDLKDLNFKLISLANNHTVEFGWKGLLDTLEEVEKRGLIAIGAGRSLDDAKLARFYDAPTGRAGFVCASATGSHLAVASNNGSHTPARAGLLPLRWKPSYVLPEEQFKQLDEIDKLLGTRHSMTVNAAVEIKDLVGPDRFTFGHIFESNLTIVKAKEGEKAHVRTTADTGDIARILKSIDDCVQRSNLPIFALHTHEGDNNNWYTTKPPLFIQKIARQSIDHGAKAFIGHGAHMLRGVEIYKGRPIFYNVGSFLMEFEIGDSFIGPEMYANYGLDPYESRPSDLHNLRSYGPNGENIGFRSGRPFSVNICVELEIDEDNEDSFTFKIIPIDLGLDTRTNKLKRGLPEWAKPDVANWCVTYLEEASAEWGTKFEYDEKTGYIHIVS